MLHPPSEKQQTQRSRFELIVGPRAAEEPEMSFRSRWTTNKKENNVFIFSLVILFYGFNGHLRQKQVFSIILPKTGLPAGKAALKRCVWMCSNLCREMREMWNCCGRKMWFSATLFSSMFAHRVTSMHSSGELMLNIWTMLLEILGPQLRYNWDGKSRREFDIDFFTNAGMCIRIHLKTGN